MVRRVSLSAARSPPISRRCSDITTGTARPCNCIKRRVPPSSSSRGERSMMPTLRNQQRRDTKGQKRGVASSSDEITEYRQSTRPLKKQKRGHSYFPPPKFWDGLSTIPLTRNAIRELDRRNRLSSHSPSRIQTLRTPRQPSTLQRFARQGGPDLSAIRGVSIARYYTRFGADNNLVPSSNRLGQQHEL